MTGPRRRIKWMSLTPEIEAALRDAYPDADIEIGEDRRTARMAFADRLSADDTGSVYITIAVDFGEHDGETGWVDGGWDVTGLQGYPGHVGDTTAEGLLRTIDIERRRPARRTAPRYPKSMQWG